MPFRRFPNVPAITEIVWTPYEGGSERLRVTSNIGFCTEGDPSDPTNWVASFANGNLQGVLVTIEQPYAWIRFVGGEGEPTSVEYAVNGMPLYFGDCSTALPDPRQYSLPFP